MRIYKLNLNIEGMTHFHELLLLAEEELQENGDEQGAFKYHQTRLLVEEQLEAQGIRFVEDRSGEDGQS